MKKVLAVLLALAMVFCLAACGEAKEEEKQPEVKAVKFGLGLYTPNAKDGGNIKDATADADGSVQIDSCGAAVLVDADGKIVDVFFDVAQTKLVVTDKGQVKDKDAEYRSKFEKQGDYGMQKASKLEKGEWFQQVGFLQDYLKGKTLADVKAIALNGGKATSADILAGCTINIPDFLEALKDAFNNLEDAGSAEKVALGVYTITTSSKDATADADGVAQFDATFCGAALDAAGKITADQINVAQLKFAVTDKGTIADATNYVNKRELKENYGMQKASKLEKGEWFQQADFFESKLVGKTKADIAALKLNGNKPADADILAGCTINVEEFVKAFERGL